MHNKKKILNEGEGESSLALIGLIMKKIKNVAFKAVYEKLLNVESDEKANDPFKSGFQKFVIENYEDLLNLEKTDNPPSATVLGMKSDEEQKKALTSGKLGEEAFDKIKKMVINTEDKETFDKLGDQFNDVVNDESRTKTLKELIFKYDPLKDSTSTHIFAYTKLERYFITKRTGLEKAYEIDKITNKISQAATIFHHLKKIRLMILKVQKVSRDLHGQKVKSDDKEIKTIGDIISEVEQQTDDSHTDNLIKAFVGGKGKIGLNPFAIADELLYSVYGEEKLKKFMKRAEEMHDYLNDVSDYVLKVLKSRSQEDSGETDSDIKGVDDPNDSKVIENARDLYKGKIEKKYKYKNKQGELKDVSGNILNVLDILASSIVKQFVPADEEQGEGE